MVEDVLLQDPDVEDAKFEILDLSANPKTGLREFKTTNSADVQRVAPGRKIEMLDIFAEGFILATADHGERNVQQETRDRPDDAASDQLSLL